MFVHYASTRIDGTWLLPWNELPEDARAAAGHFGRVHDDPRYRRQWRPDRVYVHELPDESILFSIGTVYASPRSWVYEVSPRGLIEPDPEFGGHLPSSRTCERAKILRVIHQPTF